MGAPFPMPWNEAGFAAALVAPDRQAPDGLAGPSQRRFAVYRNNVAVGLIGALEARFPAVLDLVGQDFFHGLARAYLSSHPPDSPLLMRFGDVMADFLDTFPPAESLPYLADVARIEAARTRSYHAADAARLGLPAYSTLTPEGLGACRVVLHPAVAVLPSAHPAVTIFEMATGQRPAGEIADWAGEDALVDRPHFDVTLTRLAPGQALFLSALASGDTVSGAAGAAGAGVPDFDLSQALALLIGGALACRLIPSEDPSHEP